MEVIRFENIGKLYRLGQIGSGTLKQDLNDLWNKIRSGKNVSGPIAETNDREKKGSSNIVWALQDINFSLNQGEVLGIVGKNGAGKSTLLKLLSRVTLPSTGTIKVKGKMASLLEVGTGFHPELSGRDNIFLNGAILGMTRAEIASKFDEIVAFSGVERYIDTPVKRYSSGMYVRLAFAVAAHLEPDILIIDEVLAVGDTEFQKKCIGKMKEVSGQGRTVLFVSHNMSAVKSLCTKGLLLKQGKVEEFGDITNVLAKYSSSETIAIDNLLNHSRRSGLGDIQFSAIKISSNEEIICSGGKLFIELEFSVKNFKEPFSCEFAFGVWNSIDIPMFMITNSYLDKEILIREPKGKVTFIINSLPLNTGLYNVNILIKRNNIDQDFIENVCQFQVENGNFYRSHNFYPSDYEGQYVDFTLLEN